MIGKLIGNYKILDKLSETQTGALYKAVDTLQAREVVIKVRGIREPKFGKLQLSICEEGYREAGMDSSALAQAELVKEKQLSAVFVDFGETGQTNGRKLRKNLKQANNTAQFNWRPALAGAAILIMIVFHSVSRFTLFKSENLLSEVDSPKAENNRLAEIHPSEFHPRKSVKRETLKAAPIVQPERDKIVPVRSATRTNVSKNKETARESRAARLRRAERILTGV